MTQKKGINKLSSFHFNENCSPFLDSLCEPLFKNFGITHFGCIRILENGQMLRIANNKEWTRRYFHYEFYNDLDIYAMENIPINERNFKILSGPPLSDHCKMLCSEFNIWNFMLVYEKFPTYGELWFFGTCRENTQILDFYINNMHVFQHFIVYFKNKAIHLLDMNDSSHLIQTFIRPFTENLSGETQAQKFTTELNYKKIYLSGEYSGKFLSKREAQCLLLFSKGYTMREIAEHIHLSPRTVETYFKNVKDKLGCYTKSELLSAFSQIYSLHI